MKALPAETRIQNVGSNPDFCRCCLNDGLVSVGTSTLGTEQAAPCPYCARGFRVEYPEKGRGPWGSDGYWQGRDVPAELEAPRPGKPEPYPIQRERLRALRESLGHLPRGMLDG